MNMLVTELSENNMPTYEYKPEEPVMWIANGCVSDITTAMIREVCTLQINVAMRRDANGIWLDCANKPIRIARLPVEGKTFDELSDQITSDVSTKHIDIEYQLWLDASKLSAIYEKTRFAIQIEIIAIEGARATQQQLKTLEFYLEPFHQQSELKIEFYNLLTQPNPPSQDVSKSHDILVFKQEFPAMEGSTETQSVLKLLFKNTAKMPDCDNINNVINIKKIHLANHDKHELLLVYGHEHGFDAAKPNSRRAIAIQGQVNPVTLLPQQSHRLEIELLLKLKHPSPAFRAGILEDKLTIEYQKWNMDTESLEDCSQIFEFTIPLQQEFTSSVLAIDLGTTALCAVQKTPQDEAPVLLPLGELWLKNQARIEIPTEKSNVLIASDLYCTVDKGRRIDIAPPVRLQLGANHSNKSGAKQNFYWMPNLKAHIIASEEVYKVDDDLELDVLDIVQQTYTRIDQDYFQIHAKQNEQLPYKRIVLTHPNSYVDGQQDFLHQAIEEKFPNAQITLMSESDAVMYYYLRKGMSRAITESNPFKPQENILCYDMGGGTLDLSLRRIQFEEVQGIKNAVENAESGEFIGMVSVSGAGNQLTQIIAEVMDDAFTRLEQWHQDKVDNEVLEADDIVILPRFSKSDNEDKLYSQMDGLLRIANIIQQQKIDMSAQSGDFNYIEIPLPKVSEQADFAFAQISPNAINLLKQESEPPCELEFGKKADKGSITLRLPMSIIEQKLEQEFYPKHINEPLEAILIDNEQQLTHVDTLLISGRSMLFPGLEARLLRYLEKKGLEPNVWRANDKQTDPTKSQEALKSVVAAGALMWGAETMTKQELFDPPKLIGTIGIAIRYKTGKWQWHPMFSEADMKLSWEERHAKQVTGLDVRIIDQIMIVQSFIRDGEQVQERWLNLDGGEDEEVDITIGRLVSSGYFRVIYQHPNMHFLLSLAKDRMMLELMLYHCEERDDLPRIHESSEFYGLDGTLELRAEIDGKIEDSGSQLFNGEMKPKHLNKVSLLWPHSVFSA